MNRKRRAERPESKPERKVEGWLGGGILFKREPLNEGEVVRDSFFGVWRIARFLALGGRIFFTSERVAYVPQHLSLAEAHSVYYDDIVEWTLERIRQIGIGQVVPLRKLALIITVRRGERRVCWQGLWPASTSDLETIARRNLPESKLVLALTTGSDN